MIMAQFTIREIYNGKKYNILKAAMGESIDGKRPREIGERAWFDMLIVKHTLIVIETMKKEGDSVLDIIETESSSCYMNWNLDHNT